MHRLGDCGDDALCVAECTEATADPSSLRSIGMTAQTLGSRLIQEHGAIKSVALDWFESGIADDAAQLFFGGAV